MHAAVKAGLETILCASGAAALGRRRYASSTIILAYHNIVPDGEPASGDVSLHLPQADFGAQLDLLARTHDVVPLSDLDRGVRSTRPRAIITFDDAYAGTLTAGVEELARRGLTATVFVAPAFVDGGTFWWDALATDAGVGERVRQHAFRALQGLDARVRAWAATRGLALREGPAHQRCATEEQLRAAVDRGMTLGSHSWSHPSLPTLDSVSLRRELLDSKRWLDERFEGVLGWLAYPYGHVSVDVMKAAREAGYRGALRVDGGWFRPDAADAFAVPRQNIPAGISIRGFELRVSGVTD